MRLSLKVVTKMGMVDISKNVPFSLFLKSENGRLAVLSGGYLLTRIE